MREQDFLSGKFKETKFRVYSPGELITTQEEVDDFAIKFTKWIEELRSSEIDTIDYDLYFRYNTEELLKIYKKQQ
jgi:hypothetical protein